MIYSSAQTPHHAHVSANRRPLHRKCACGGVVGPTGECARCRALRLARATRGSGTPSRTDVQPAVQAGLQSQSTPLASGTRQLMESRIGHDFSRVRVHTGGPAAASASAVAARAYTVGEHIVFGAGEYAPHTTAGTRLLAHELAHTVQQRTEPTLQREALSVTWPSDPVEREADQVAAAVVDGRRASPTPGRARSIARQPVAPAASGLGSGVITGGVSGLTHDVSATYTPCTDCADGLEAIQVFWGTRRIDGVQVGTTTTVFPPLAATYDTFVDGGIQSPGGAVYSGNHPYYIGRPDLPASYGYIGGAGSAGKVRGCTANPRDLPGAARLHDEAFFETAIVCLKHRGGNDRLLDSWKWGFVGRGTTYKPDPRSSQTSGLQQQASPTSKFLATLRADYPGYSFST